MRKLSNPDRDLVTRNSFMSISWKASLVPAAAVIPAIVYINVVVVKRLVVGFLLRMTGLPSECHLVQL